MKDTNDTTLQDDADSTTINGMPIPLKNGELQGEIGKKIEQREYGERF
jgi:hypothetical protein